MILRLLLVSVFLIAAYALVAINLKMAKTEIDTSPVGQGFKIAANQTPDTSNQEIHSQDKLLNRIQQKMVQTLKRPLFVQSRRPYVPPLPKPIIKAAAPPKPEPVVMVKSKPIPKPKLLPPTPKPILELFGISGPKNNSRALVSENGSEARWMKKSSKIGPWKIISITPKGIELALKNRRAKYLLHKPTANAGSQND